MTERKGWYLIAYDIANQKRLTRVHALTRNEGVALQKSVFLVRLTAGALNGLMDRLATCINKKEDELRAYPIGQPSTIWSNRVLLPETSYCLR